MSLLQKQLRIGDACTFRLIEKNVVSLLPPSKDYLKNQAAGALTDLIRQVCSQPPTGTSHMPASVPYQSVVASCSRSYEDLEDILYRAHGGDMFAAEKAFDALQVCVCASNVCKVAREEHLLTRTAVEQQA